METTVLPQRLAIVGAGPIGIEFAGVYRGFGSEVTLFEAGSGILDREDDDVAAPVEALLRDDGVQIVARARVTEVRDGRAEAIVSYERDGRQHSLVAEKVLAAVGRKPATTNLGLEAAGVRTTERGAIQVDEYLRTTQPHIYALGDVDVGQQQTTSRSTARGSCWRSAPATADGRQPTGSRFHARSSPHRHWRASA
jgi:probable pyridine nucleotide-disulfide oxidoreductase